MVREEEDRQRAEQFTEVGTTNNDLGPSTDPESTLGVSGGEGGLQEPVEIESQSITGKQPCKTVKRSSDENGDQKSAYR